MFENLTVKLWNNRVKTAEKNLKKVLDKSDIRGINEANTKLNNAKEKLEKAKDAEKAKNAEKAKDAKKAKDAEERKEKRENADWRHFDNRSQTDPQY